MKTALRLFLFAIAAAAFAMQTECATPNHRHAATKAQKARPKGWSEADAPGYARDVLHWVNVERKKRGLRPLRLSQNCQGHAQKRSREITKRFSHKGCFRGFRGYRCKGENIAKGFRSGRAVVNAWMRSKGHRANILSKRYQHLGVGRTGNAWVQIFGGR